MKIRQQKIYRCAVCNDRTLIETRLCSTYEGDIPDKNNSDLNDYSDYRKMGGKFFKKRDNVSWEKIGKTIDKEKWAKIPVGGICEGCLLTSQAVKSLIPYLLFEEERR